MRNLDVFLVLTALAMGSGPKTSYVAVPSPSRFNTSSLSRDGTVCCWGRDDGSVFLKVGQNDPTLLLKERWGIASVAVSQDGAVLAFSCYEGSVSFWDLRNRKKLWKLQAHDRYAVCLALSPDRTLLATGGEEGRICLWETKGPHKVRTFLHHPQSKSRSPTIKSLSFSANGKYLASASYDHTVKMWDIIEGRAVFSFEGEEEFDSVRFSPDGRSFAIAGRDDPFLRVFETVTGNERANIKHQHSQLVCAFSNSNLILVSGGRDNRVTFFDIGAARRILDLEGHKDTIRCITISGDGKTMVTSGFDPKIYFWTLNPPVLSRQPYEKKAIASAWKDLSSSDGMKAYQAIYRLVCADRSLDYPKTEIGDLVERNISEERFRRILLDLDSEQFNVRKQAAKELDGLGSEARPLIRKALDEKQPLDIFRRLRQFLEKSQPVSQDYVTLTRVLEVLENRNDIESVAFLKEISEGKGIAAQDAGAAFIRRSSKK